MDASAPYTDLAEPRAPKRLKNGGEEMDLSEDTMRGEKETGIRRWEDLPVNCLVEIFKKLSMEDMTTGVPFVCKSWYEAHLDPSCWKILDVRGIDPWSGSPFIENPFIERFMHEYRLTKFTVMGFLKFVINRSHKLATKLIVPDRLLPLSNLVYFCKQCPMVNIYASWQPEQNPGLIRGFVMKLNEVISLNCRNLEL
ncbi:F-box/LRR-repeat protein At3g48880-like [Phoenix dactylifera]|uniref:F-box/LRR-repeat protein At3g48880-like n=1 Tax=Phoenix dactylifera TaxID=42345 RepID=A0A8B8ZAT1_PHODC|nr:F-box/LRR-repeat protein At3g48880-like [Phoenix dactylifera]